MRIDYISCRVVITFLLFSALFSTGCGRTSPGRRSVDTVVTNNLVRIWHHLFTAMGEGDRFPASLAEPIKSQPTKSDLDANLLVCPGTGGAPGR